MTLFKMKATRIDTLFGMIPYSRKEQKLKSGLLEGATKVCKIEKNDFLIVCQNEGRGELVPKKEDSDRSGFYFFFPGIFHNLRVAAA